MTAYFCGYIEYTYDGHTYNQFNDPAMSNVLTFFSALSGGPGGGPIIEFIESPNGELNSVVDGTSDYDLALLNLGGIYVASFFPSGVFSLKEDLESAFGMSPGSCVWLSSDATSTSTPGPAWSNNGAGNDYDYTDVVSNSNSGTISLSGTPFLTFGLSEEPSISNTNFDSPVYDDTNTHPRWILPNKINAGNLSCDHDSSGWTSFPQATKVGNAKMSTSVMYPGLTEADYIVEIDSVAAGQTIGYSTFRWGKQFLDGSGLTFLDFGIPTTDQGYEIESGLFINFMSGITSPDFISRDRWTFRGIKQHGIEKMLGFDRSDFFLPQTVDGHIKFVVDFTNETIPDVDTLILYDHNFTELTNIVYSVGSTIYESPLHNKGKDIFTFTKIGYPLHTIDIDYTDELDSNANFIPQIGKLHLSRWISLKRGRDPQYIRSRVISGDIADLRNRWIENDVEHLEFTYPLIEGFTESEDVERLMNTIRSSCVNVGAPQTPIFFQFNPTVYYDFGLYFIDNPDNQLAGIFRNLFNTSIKLTEVSI